MEDFRTKLKRQIEIISLVTENPNQYTIFDLAAKFNISEITVKRDLQEIRGMGIDIHSSGKKGINIFTPLNDEMIKLLIAQYTGIISYQNLIDKSVSLLVSKSGIRSLYLITTLQNAIEEKKKIKIQYQRVINKPPSEKILEPYYIFQSDKQWRLLGSDNGMIKQFILCNILSVEVLNEKFNILQKNEIENIFSTSFKSWLSEEKIIVKLRLLPPWSERVLSKPIMENQVITKNSDGSVILEVVVNSLGEVASWVVSRGEGVIVLEPEDLRNYVIEIAKGVLKNYN